MKLYVTTAFRTGLWLDPAALQERARETSTATNAAAMRSSATALTGMMAAASFALIESVSADDRVAFESALRANPAGRGFDVTDVSIRHRDIDATTSLTTLEPAGPIDEWLVVASMADAVVDLSSAWSGGVVGMREELPAGSVLYGSSRHDGPLSADVAAPGTPLWCHTLMVCSEAALDSHHRCTSERARQVLPTDFETVAIEGTSVYLGLHASLICSSDDERALRIVGLMDELHAWWTATWDLDLEMLEVARVMSKMIRRGQFPEMRRSADFLSETTGLVGVLRARIDSYRLSLGGLEWPVWDAASRRWALAENFDCLQNKRTLLTELTTSFRDVLAAHQSARLNQVAGIFATLTSLASLVAVLVFVFPWMQSRGSTAVRLILVGFALVITLLGLVWSSAFLTRMVRTVSHQRSMRGRRNEVELFLTDSSL